MSALALITARKGTTLTASVAGLCLRAGSMEAKDQGRFNSIVSTLNPWQPLSYRHAKPEGGQEGG